MNEIQAYISKHSDSDTELLDTGGGMQALVRYLQDGHMVVFTDCDGDIPSCFNESSIVILYHSEEEWLCDGQASIILCKGTAKKCLDFFFSIVGRQPFIPETKHFWCSWFDGSNVDIDFCVGSKFTAQNGYTLDNIKKINSLGLSESLTIHEPTQTHSIVRIK